MLKTIHSISIGRSSFFILIVTIVTMKANGQPCSDLFISEYVEGTSYNKMIEIYNPTTASVDLSGYQLQTYFNAAQTPTSMTLSGILDAGEVWVGCHPLADSNIVNQFADDVNSFVINWNGNDAVALVNLISGSMIDVIGLIGDSVSSWEVGSGTTENYTLVREAPIQHGNPDWYDGAYEWNVFPEDDFSHIGSHSMIPCLVVPDPTLYFTSDTIFVNESAGTFDVEVGIVNPNSNITSVELSVTGGTAVNGTDYNFTSPQIISFLPNSSIPIIVSGTITNDIISEGDESIQISLGNPTNQATIINGTIKVTIVDNDGLGTENSLSSAVELFPNMSGGIFTLSATYPSEIFLYDLSGREVLRSNVLAGTTTLNLSDFPVGMFWLLVENDDSPVIRKIVIQR